MDKRWLAGFALFLLLSNAQAVLIDRGNGMIYDSDQDLTWLQDANYAQTSGYDADGRMNWIDAMDWADNLVYGGFSDWRLPTMTDIDNNGCTEFGYGGSPGAECGYNVDTSLSEFAYMFHENLGNRSGYDASGTETGCTAPNYCLENTSADGVDIFNLYNSVYWIGTEYAIGQGAAWFFALSGGVQSVAPASYEMRAWAVRSGDVGMVPEPSVMMLLGAGLAGLGFTKRLAKRRP